MHQIHSGTNRVLISNTASFVKRSSFFALLYATMGYTLVRLFFYDFPFSISEGFELHCKILFVVWSFIIACKIVVSLIIILENNFSKMKAVPIMYSTILKSLFGLILPAAPVHAAKTPVID